MSTQDDRDDVKARHERYREAVKHLYPNASVRPLVSVNETAELDGAFVEITVWIPRQVIDWIESKPDLNPLEVQHRIHDRDHVGALFIDCSDQACRDAFQRLHDQLL